MDLMSARKQGANLRFLAHCRSGVDFRMQVLLSDTSQQVIQSELRLSSRRLGYFECVITWLLIRLLAIIHKILRELINALEQRLPGVVVRIHATTLS